MTVSATAWNSFIDTLAAISQTAAKKFTAYLDTHKADTAEGRKAAIDYAAALAEKYGESAAVMSCEMYDAIAEASGALVPAAEAAAVPEYGEVAKTVNGMFKQNQSNEATGAAIGRLVKRTGVDTTMKNAIRDGAEWAWIPSGDTCAFCLMLASNGWQHATKEAMKGNHASHIHANCDCTYAIRFDSSTRVAGYDPDEYKAMYDNAEGDTWQEKLNSMRREQYSENRDSINARKRELYAAQREAAKRQERELLDLYQKYGSVQNLLLYGSQNDMMKYGELTGATGLTEMEIRSKMLKEPDWWESLLTNSSTNELKRQTAWLLEQTTDDELHSLSMWTGETFGNINKIMRYGEEVDQISAEAAKNIENALSRAKTNEDMIVKRGTGTRHMFAQMGVSWGEDASAYLGKTWKDNGFVAATPYKNGGFGGPGKDHAELFIMLPKGTHALYIEEASRLNLEKETLIQRGYSYRVIKAEYRENPYDKYERDLKLWVELII